MVVTSPSRTSPYSSTLSSDLEKIGRVLVGEHLPAIAKAVFAHAELRNHLLTKFLDLVDKECNELCRKTTNVSPFRHIAVKEFTGFTWDKLSKHLKSKAPTLYKIASIIVSHSDKRNEMKKGEQHMPGICMAVATLLKERNREMCGIQSIISVALFASQVQKKVSIYLDCSYQETSVSCQTPPIAIQNLHTNYGHMTPFGGRGAGVCIVDINACWYAQAIQLAIVF